MPSRSCTLAILAFWLGTMGWYCWKDVWPRLRPGERQPYTIDLSEEVTSPVEPRRWDLYRNGRRVGWANTWVKYRREDDTYALFGKYGFNLGEDAGPNATKMEFSFLKGLVRIQANSMQSTNWVTRDGDLRELKGQVSLTAFGPADLIAGKGAAVEVRVAGRVQDGTLRPHWRLRVGPHGDEKAWEFERDTEPVQVANNHSVLNPLQPWNRLHNIRPGQTWRVQLFDPLAESASASINTVMPVNLPRVEYLDAVVHEVPDDQPWDKQTVSCLIVEYRGENFHAKTWVRESDGLVIRQEATRDEDTPQEERLALERKP